MVPNLPAYHVTENYRNHRNDIGYSFRSQTMDLLNKKKIKILSIDGIAPAPENIRNESYPSLVFDGMPRFSKFCTKMC